MQQQQQQQELSCKFNNKIADINILTLKKSLCVNFGPLYSFMVTQWDNCYGGQLQKETW